MLTYLAVVVAIISVIGWIGNSHERAEAERELEWHQKRLEDVREELAREVRSREIMGANLGLTFRFSPEHWVAVPKAKRKGK